MLADNKMPRLWPIFGVLTLLLSLTEGTDYVRFCYFTSWSRQRPSPNARISLDQIDPHLCTHLLYAFANIDTKGNTIVASDPPQELPQGNGLYAQFNQLKQRNPQLKTLLSIGGQYGKDKFVQIASSNQTISDFSQNAISFVTTHGFDGLDVDWEFPDATSKSKYTALIKGLHDRISQSGNTLLLTSAVSSGEPVINAGYDIPEVSKYLDYILVMSYDFFGTWSQVTGFNSPLVARDDPNFSTLYNVHHAIDVWVRGVTDRRKIVLGMTGAGASFTLTNSSDHGVGAPVTPGGGPPGSIFQLKGRLIYPEICENLSSGWTRVWDEEQQAPYAYHDTVWVGYDDVQSITRKANYTKEQGIGGVMFWELSFDDPHELCNDGKFPLLNAVKTTLGGTDVTVAPDGGETTLSPKPETTKPTTSEGMDYVRFCYFTSWSRQRPSPNARISLDQIDPHLCTHLLYAFANIDTTGNTIVASDPSQELPQGGNPGLFAQFNQLKQRNPQLKTLLSIGGQYGKDKFVQIASSGKTISDFSQNAISFVTTHGFDGLDIDWEFPDATSKSKYTALIKGLHDRISQTGNTLLLTSAVSSGEHVINAGYDIPEVSKYLDYIIVMSYDFFGTWSQVTGFNSPLVARDDPNFSPLYNVHHAIDVWVSGVTDRRKIVLGMTGAGASFTLTNSSDHGVGAPVTPGGGPPGSIFQLKGRLIYPEICEKLSSGWNRVWDEEQQAPYAYHDTVWVGYDDVQSITRKANYTKEKGIGGVMFWELSFDDPHELCNDGKFPLLNAVKTTLGGTDVTATPDVGETTLSLTTPSDPEITTPITSEGTSRSSKGTITSTISDQGTTPSTRTVGSTEPVGAGSRNTIGVLLCSVVAAVVVVVI